MYPLASVASAIRNDRHPVPDDAPLKQAEAKMFDAVRDALINGRIARDAAVGRLFDRIYGSAGVSVPAEARERVTPAVI